MRKILLSILIFLLTSSVAYASASTIQDAFLSLIKANALPLSRQAYCVSTASSSIAAYNDTVKVIPASVSKLYTFDFALNTLGKDFRYTTDIYLNGNTLYINGGGDPHFVIENLRSIVEEVNSDQHSVISRFVFSPNFYFNWKLTPASITSSMTASLKENSGAPIDPKFTVAYSAKPYAGTGIHYQFQSAPLSILVKQINDYSTNLSADVLFQKAGGPAVFATYMQKTYGANASTVKFGTGSGLSDNYTTCGLTLKVIQHLEATATAQGIGIENIMSVPRVDPGVLQKILPAMATTLGMVAKSGFLDFHHNLSGIVYTTTGPLYFAVFGGYANLKDEAKTEQYVQAFVTKLFAPYVQVPLPYIPHNNEEVPANTLITKI